MKKLLMAALLSLPIFAVAELAVDRNGASDPSTEFKGLIQTDDRSAEALNGHSWDAEGTAEVVFRENKSE